MLCENNVAILGLLSEEIFDFSKESLTAAKAEALRASMTGQFEGIFELFDFILQVRTGSGGVRRGPPQHSHVVDGR